jgi:hypothetical protein
VPADRKPVLEILTNAQFVYSLTRDPRQQVVGDQARMRALRERLEAMRVAARSLTKVQRAGLEKELALLEDIDSGTDAVWKAAKRATPKLIDQLAPFVRDDPEAAFLISGVSKRGRAAAKEREPEEPEQKPAPPSKVDTRLSGKELAGLKVLIQERANADDEYFSWLRGNHSLPLAEWRRRRSKAERARRAEDEYIDKLFRSRAEK